MCVFDGFVVVFFFFKQKKAYEMRISDWSSDVCSSDLSYENLLDGKGTYFGHSVGNKTVWKPELAAQQINAARAARVKPYLHMSGPVSIEALNVDSAVRAQGMMRQRAGIQMFGLEQTVRLPCTTTGCRSMALLMPQNNQDRNSTRLNSSHSCAPRMP